MTSRLLHSTNLRASSIKNLEHIGAAFSEGIKPTIMASLGNRATLPNTELISGWSSLHFHGTQRDLQKEPDTCGSLALTRMDSLAEYIKFLFTGASSTRIELEITLPQKPQKSQIRRIILVRNEGVK